MTMLQPGLFEATITTAFGETRYTDRRKFDKAAGEWRSTPAHQLLYGNTCTSKPEKPRTISHSKTISVPKSWNALTPAAQRKARECSPLDAVEREWLGKHVRWVADGEWHGGEVWAIAPRGFLWVTVYPDKRIEGVPLFKLVNPSQIIKA